MTAPKVLVFTNGKRFHHDRGDGTATCNVSRVGALARRRTARWALDAGFTPCHRCELTCSTKALVALVAAS